jgi:hypothetical protein
MILLFCCFGRSRVATLYKSIRSFRDIDRDGLLGAAAFMSGVDEKVQCFYTMLNFLLDTFVPVRRQNNVPGFSFATISEGEICDTVMSIRLDAAGVDGIPL